MKRFDFKFNIKTDTEISGEVIRQGKVEVIFRMNKSVSIYEKHDDSNISPETYNTIVQNLFCISSFHFGRKCFFRQDDTI